MDGKPGSGGCDPPEERPVRSPSTNSGDSMPATQDNTNNIPPPHIPAVSG